MRKYPVRSVQRWTPARWRSASAPPTRRASPAPPAVVSEVQNDADLSRMMQELPAVEDLLETSDDAPIIRMLNALLTQAARDGASDIHIEPYERHLQRALPGGRHAARGGAAQPRLACRADLAPEDHGRAGHCRKAPAAGRAHQPCASAPGRWMCA
jgi:hypothetical protein